MEHLHSATFPESLQATLNCYKLTSVDSLSGPSGFPALAAQMWFKENKQLPPIQPQPMVQIPFFIPNDKSAKRSDTFLAGEKIACFIVGGEKRLCLPQILTSVLREYSIAEINQACADLHIYCSRCLPEQLEVLKVLGILPINTGQCGLITKTDAERLVALLMDQHEPVKSILKRLPKNIDPDSGFQVYHECFGRGYGKIYPKLYVSPVTPCVMCDDCRCMYSPQRFIAHSHRSFEKRTCHWGFDPENWRSYLLLPKNLDGNKRSDLEKVLEQVKARFDPSRFDMSGLQPTPATSQYSSSPPTPNKRRYESDQESPIRKKIKEEEKIFDPGLLPHPYASLQYAVSGGARHSAFRPWSPGLPAMAAANPGDIPVIQDLSHLKGLLPLAFDGRGLPQFQNGRPVVLESRSSELPISAQVNARAAPNVRLAPAEEQKRASESIKSDSPEGTRRKTPVKDITPTKDKNNNNEGNIPIQASNQYIPSKLEPTRKRSLERSPLNHSRKLSMSPTKPVSVQEVSARSSRGISPGRYMEAVVPVIPTSQPLLPFSPTRSTTFSHSSNSSIAIKEPRDLSVLARPVSRSREAAATAMLELKSAGSFRSVSMSSQISPPMSASASLSSNAKCDIWKPASSVANTPAKPTSTSGSVVPLDSSRQHYKWTIAGHSYIISAAGLQSLDAVRSLVESECGKDTGKERIMHELVKMKSLYEEKIDIEMRVRRDLEMELEHVRATKRDKLRSMSEERDIIRREMENMRQEHAKRLDEMNRCRDLLEKQLEKARRGRSVSGDSNIESSTEKELKNLLTRIYELESKNDTLRISLNAEREKREKAELKLEEATEMSRGRISLLMNSPLSRLVRVPGRKNSEQEVDKSPPPSPCTFQSPGNKKAAPQATALLGSVMVSHCQHNGMLPQATLSANVPTSSEQEKSLPPDPDTPNTVVFT